MIAAVPVVIGEAVRAAAAATVAAVVTTAAAVAGAGGGGPAVAAAATAAAAGVPTAGGAQVPFRGLLGLVRGSRAGALQEAKVRDNATPGLGELVRGRNLQPHHHTRGVGRDVAP